jgi:hypothetical protein
VLYIVAAALLFILWQHTIGLVPLILGFALAWLAWRKGWLLSVPRFRPTAVVALSACFWQKLNP